MNESQEMPNGWTKAIFEDLLDYIQPTKFIVESTEYNEKYKTPVLTAGKSFIIGYTNENKGIFKELPVIIFDDFTTATQFVNFPFKVKSSAMKILKPTCKLVCIKYVFNFMKTINVNVDTHKRYWISHYSKLPIPLPPLPEQQRIVAMIEELFSSLDKGIESLKTAQQQLKIYRQAVLKWAFEGKLTNTNVKEGELPEGWQKVNLGEISEKIQIGPFGTQLHKEDYIMGGIPLINPMHFKDGVIEADSSYSITKKKRDSLPNYILKEGDIIMGRRGEMGRYGLVRKKEAGYFCGTGSLYIRPKSKVANSIFLFHCLKGRIVKKYLEENAAGTTMANLNAKIVNGIPICLPSIKEQQTIVAEIESRLSVCDKIEESIEQSLKQSESLRQSILKKAFEGKLVPQDPNDEPASKLLERIKAEKEKTESKKKKGRLS